jgi:hypothetical protein
MYFYPPLSHLFDTTYMNQESPLLSQSTLQTKDKQLLTHGRRREREGGREGRGNKGYADSAPGYSL